MVLILYIITHLLAIGLSPTMKKTVKNLQLWVWICLFLFVFLKFCVTCILNFNYSCCTFKIVGFSFSIYSFIIIKYLFITASTPFLEPCLDTAIATSIYLCLVFASFLYFDFPSFTCFPFSLSWNYLPSNITVYLKWILCLSVVVIIKSFLGICWVS